MPARRAHLEQLRRLAAPLSATVATTGHRQLVAPGPRGAPGSVCSRSCRIVSSRSVAVSGPMLVTKPRALAAEVQPEDPLKIDGLAHIARRQSSLSKSAARQRPTVSLVDGSARACTRCSGCFVRSSLGCPVTIRRAGLGRSLCPPPGRRGPADVRPGETKIGGSCCVPYYKVGLPVFRSCRARHVGSATTNHRVADGHFGIIMTTTQQVIKRAGQRKFIRIRGDSTSWIPSRRASPHGRHPPP